MLACAGIVYALFFRIVAFKAVLAAPPRFSAANCEKEVTLRTAGKELGLVVAAAPDRAGPSPSGLEAPVVVTEVKPGGPADGKVRRGDFLVSVNGVPVEDAAGATQLLGVAADELELGLLCTEAALHQPAGNLLIRAMVGGLIVLGFGVWVAASIAGAGMGLAHTVIAIFGAGAVALVVLIAFIVAQSDPSLARDMTNKVEHALRGSSIARAAVVFFAAPLFAGYIVFAFLNKLCRLAGMRFAETRCLCKRINPREPLSLMDTPRTFQWAVRHTTDPAAKALVWLYESEQKTQVLVWVMWGGVLVWALLLGSTLTYVCLAGLIELLSSIHWLLVSLIFFVVGFVMFMVPVVPGLAVYLCGGILLVQRCRDPFGGGEGGFYLAILWASFLSWILKMIAHVGQQKLFGEQLGTYVSIRAKCQINSNAMKAVKYLVSRPGLSVAKVCILCGGPDWPTSVVCGILRKADPPSINTAQLVVGLTPMVLLIVPTCLAAAFQLRITNGADDGSGGPWDALASVALITCAAIQLGAGMAAVHYISEVLTTHTAELDAYKVDEEVEAYEAAQEKKRRATLEATRFGALPTPLAALLCCTAMLLTFSAYLLIFGQTYCFENFNLASDRVSDISCVSCERALVKVCYAVMCYAMLCCAMLCCATLRSATLCYAMLCYAMLVKPLGWFALCCLGVSVIGWCAQRESSLQSPAPRACRRLSWR